MDRKALIPEYKDTPRPAGVYRIQNAVNGKWLTVKRDRGGETIWAARRKIAALLQVLLELLAGLDRQITGP